MMKKVLLFFIFLTVFTINLNASNINKISIISISQRTLYAKVFGINTNSLLVMYNNENQGSKCSLVAAGASFDGIIRKWTLKCKLPKSSGRLVISFTDSFGKRQEISKFIE